MKQKNLNRIQILIFLILPLLTSCVQTTQEFYINPDGSGKAEISASSQADLGLNISTDTNLTPQEKYELQKKAVNEMNKQIEKSQGISAWKDVKYNMKKDGTFEFSATIYFPEFTKVRLNDVPVLIPKSFNQEGVTYTLNSKKDKKPDKPENNQLSTEQKVKAIQTQYKGSFAMLSGIAANSYVDATYHFPFQIKKSGYFDSKDRYTASIHISLGNVLAKIGNIVNDDAALKKFIEKYNVSDLKNPDWQYAVFPDGLNVDFKHGMFSGPIMNYFDYSNTLASISTKIPSFTAPAPPPPPLYTGTPEKAIVQTMPSYLWETMGSGLFDINKGIIAVVDGKNLFVSDMSGKNNPASFTIRADHPAYPSAIDINPDTSIVLVVYSNLDAANPDNLLLAVKLEDGTVLAGRSITEGPVGDAEWISNDQIAYTVGGNLKIAEFDQSSIKPLNISVQLNQQQVKSFFPVKMATAVSSKTKRPTLYSYTFEGILYAIPLPVTDGEEPDILFNLNEMKVPHQLTAGPEGKRLILSTNDSLHVFDLETNSMIAKENPVFQAITTASFNPDGTRVAYIDHGSKLTVLNLKNGNKKVLYKYEDQLQKPHAVIWSSDGSKIYTRNRRDCLKLLY